MYLASVGSLTVGGGAKPPRKPNNDKPGRSHEKEAKTSNQARAKAKKLRKQLSKAKSKEVVSTTEATDIEMKMDDDSRLTLSLTSRKTVSSACPLFRPCSNLRQLPYCPRSLAYGPS